MYIYKLTYSHYCDIHNVIHPVNVNIPRDRISALHQGFGFVEFSTEEDADYALQVSLTLYLDVRH